MIEGLSSALFHFLWQGALLALLPALALMFRSPRIRYTAACVALLAMPVAFAITLAISIAPAGPHGATPIERHHAVRAPDGSSAPIPRPFDFERSMRWFVPFWLTGVALFYLRTFIAWTAVQRLRRASSVLPPPFWRERVAELSACLGIRRAVALFGSELVDVPVVAGFLRPAIFVPAAVLSGMPVEQLEYLLIHELAHIRRFDYAVNLLQKAVEGLLFYHPAVWWVSHILRIERENCCDDAVVAMRGNAREYASVLASLEERRSWPALAANGGHLGKRVLRLLNRPTHSPVAPVFGLLAIAITAGVTWAALQQAPQAAAPLKRPYRKWLNEDVVYIITEAERTAFQGLATDEEREQFIEQFWLRRDPTPGTPRNEMKEEHYRRIGFVDAHFTGATVPGWKTDRGRIYITYGPPDEIDSHPGDATPWESWRYRWIEGVGNNVLIEFRDSNHDGSFPMTSDPHAAAPDKNKVRVDLTSSGILLTLALDPAKNFNVFVRVVTMTRRPVTTSEKTVLRQSSLQMPIELLPGQYRLVVSAKNADTAETEIPNSEIAVTVP